MFKVAFSELETLAKIYNMTDPVVSSKRDTDAGIIATAVMNLGNHHDAVFFGDSIFAIPRSKNMDIREAHTNLKQTYDSNIHLTKYESYERDYEIFLNQNVYVRQDDVNSFSLREKLYLNIYRWCELKDLKDYIVKLSEITLTIENNQTRPSKSYSIDDLIKLSASIKKGLEDIYYHNFDYNIEFEFFPNYYDYYKEFKINHSIKDYKFDERIPFTNMMVIKRHSEHRNILPIIINYVNYIINSYKWCEDVRTKKTFHMIENLKPIIISADLNKLFTMIEKIMQLPNQLKYYYISYILMDNIELIAKPYADSIRDFRKTADTDLSKYDYVHQSRNKVYLRTKSGIPFETQWKGFIKAYLAQYVPYKINYFLTQYNKLNEYILPYKKLDFMILTFFNYFSFVPSSNTFNNNFYVFNPFKRLNEKFYSSTDLNHNIKSNYNSHYFYDQKGEHSINNCSIM